MNAARILGQGQAPELIERPGEEVFPLPFVSVPPGATARVSAILQQHYRPKRFCVYADDASKLRVELTAGVTMVGSGGASVRAMPVGLFADAAGMPARAFVLHCTECGAPHEDRAAKCRYCGAPFTWRVTETAYGLAGLSLDFPTLGPGMMLEATFTSRSDEAIGVDSAFVGVVSWIVSGVSWSAGR